ncbi:hypothetical protein NQ317_003565 [Molorchus minor]|uniref:Sulfatase N-terminal domain-containing protein n=1 Tax=Molorchus minor TaxID=1323400 RepID=A0ABQ9JCZ9_9CUCU|nr:hypothetical protein NQ317_003565 [Molorchus minor]
MSPILTQPGFVIAIILGIILGLVCGIHGEIRPHIIFIIADDLGWNDVGFHGSNQIPTPNIDALAYSGLILNNYYVTPICTPSRSALMTGYYPIHTGMQHSVLYGAEARGLPLSEKLLPQYLEELGYDNHIVGKWHLGFWTGHQDYFDHTAVENPGWGLDMRRNLNVAYDLHGQYSTDIFTRESVRIINSHNVSSPLFLYLAHTAVHSGNPYEPLRAPDSEIQKFSYIKDYSRQRFAAILSKLDESVGEVVKALKNNNMLKNSIIVFTTDNGGPAAGFNLNAASNYPLKGVKNTLWEGGVRGAALVWSPLIEKSSRIANQSMHISDWLPTLVEAAGGEVTKGLDGLSIWSALSKNKKSGRQEILHNIDDIYGNSALTVGPWKIVKGTTYNGIWDSWYGPDGRTGYSYNVTLVQNSPAGLALKSIGNPVTPEVIQTIRNQATIQCLSKDTPVVCKPLESPCLFNILQDPLREGEFSTKDILTAYNKTAVPPGNLPLDPRGNPKCWDYVWTNFGDNS